MASTRVAPLARWSVAAAVALVGAALLVTAWTTRASVRDARESLLRGERVSMEQAVHADLTELGAPPTSEDLAALLSAHHDAGLRYLALLGADGTITASAGESSDDHVRLEVRGSRRAERGPGPGAGGFRHGTHVIAEFEPVESESLDAATTRVLETGLAAAVVLVIVAAFLFRLLLRREQLERERERERRLAALGELSAVLAHEIRNPLASLKGNAQLLVAQLPEGEKPRAKAERVVEEAIRLEKLTGDLLAFVRTGELARVPVDVAALIGGLAVPGAIEIDVPAGLTWSLDGDRLRQVLVNLVDNGAAAGPPPVRIAARESLGALVIDVTDRGPGVPAAERERIFEPFVTGKTRGTGLGLAIARRIVEAHGGTIAVRNEGGAVFRVEIPR